MFTPPNSSWKETKNEYRTRVQGTRESTERITDARSLIVCHVREKEKERVWRPIEACPGRSNLLSHRCFATAVRLERGNIVEPRRFL